MSGHRTIRIGWLAALAGVVVLAFIALVFSPLGRPFLKNFTFRSAPAPVGGATEKPLQKSDMAKKSPAKSPSKSLKGRKLTKADARTKKKTVRPASAHSSADEIVDKVFAMMDDSPAIKALFEKFDDFGFLINIAESLDDAKRRELRELFESDDFRKFYELLKQLSTFDTVDTRMDYSAGMEYDSPFMSKIMDIERCLVAKTSIDLADERPAEAVEALSLGLRLVNQTRNDTMPPSVMERLGTEGMLFSQTMELAQSGKLSAVQMEDLLNELSAQDPLSPLAASFDMDKMMMDNEFKGLLAGNSTAMEEMAGKYDLSPDAVRRITASKESLEKNIAACEEYTRKFQELSERPFYEAAEEIEALQNEVSALPDEYTLVKLFLGGDADLIESANGMAEMRSITLIDLATAIYRSRNDGAEPQSNQDLLGILKELPVNPVTGERF